MAIDITNSAEYTQVIRQLYTWYGDKAQKVIDVANTWELTPEQITSDWLPSGDFEPWYTSAGNLGGVNVTGTGSINTATAAQEALNSNLGSTTQTILKTPVETVLDGQTGKVTFSGGLTNVASGLKSGLTFVTQEVLPAVCAAGLGITLGKTIDSALYNLNPDFWDNNGMSSLNPETWNSITQDYPDGFLKKAFNTVFGLNPETGETQLYLDANAAAYLAMYMQTRGVFATGEMELDISNVPDSDLFNSKQGYNIHPASVAGVAYTSGRFTYTFQMTGGYAYVCNRQSYKNLFFINNQNTPLTKTTYDSRTGTTTTETVAWNTYTAKTGEPYYNAGFRVELSATKEGFPADTTPSNPNYNQTADIGHLLYFGTVTQQGGVDGITDQTGATLPNFSGCVTPADYLSALQSQYPDLFNDAVSQTTTNPDGTSKTTVYIPIGTPSQYNNNNKTQPTTDNDNSGNKQDDSGADPTNIDLTGLQTLIQTILDTLSQDGTTTDTTNPDNTGSGSSPTVTTPTGSASALWSIYNPSQAELNSFGAWLWSNNFIDQLLKLFNNPMQAIIGVHKIFATPPTNGAGNIKVGYLDSGVSANLVSAQYTTINCGTVNVGEQFGNVFDYTDTQIRIYLPFIGIIDLDTADVMRSSITVVYHVDVITGACLAEVQVIRDGSGGTLYQFSGDASVRYPISSGSYMGVVSGIASIIGGAVSAVATGGATLPLVAGGAMSALGNMSTNVQHSGRFSGNAGAMGCKKPYIIIERPQTAIASNYETYQGKGTNQIVNIGSLSGYIKMEDVHADSVEVATTEEIEEIKALLNSGVYT